MCPDISRRENCTTNHYNLSCLTIQYGDAALGLPPGGTGRYFAGNKMREEKPPLALPPVRTDRLLRSRRCSTGPPPQLSLTQEGRCRRPNPFLQPGRSHPRGRAHLPGQWNRRVPLYPFERPVAPPHLRVLGARDQPVDSDHWGQACNLDLEEGSTGYRGYQDHSDRYRV